MTYTALLCLIILGDDLSRVNRPAVIAMVNGLQQSNGSFIPCSGSLECDMRFLFCACAISFILNDWSALDFDRAVSYIRESTVCTYGSIAAVVERLDL
jgi:geranylgeranyl transferase type-1 subunit beta